MPECSIVIPSRNEGFNLMKTLDCIQRRTRFIEYEIIVVDEGDGSDLQRVQIHFPWVRRVQAGGLGVAGARNLGAAHSRSDFIAFCDAHVFPRHENWLSSTCLALCDTSIGSCAPAIGNPDNRAAVGYGGTLANWNFDFSWLGRGGQDVYDVPVLSGCCQIMRREFFEQQGCWLDELLVWGLEDVEMSVRSWLRGWRQTVNPEVIVDHLFRTSFPYRVEMKRVVRNILITAWAHVEEHNLDKVVLAVGDKVGQEQAENIFRQVRLDMAGLRNKNLALAVNGFEDFLQRFAMNLN